MNPPVIAALQIGAHPTTQFLGMTFDVDTMLSTLLAGIIVLALGFAVRARATSGVPGKMQLAFETIVTGVQQQVAQSIGPSGAAVVPLALTLFVFILIANWLELVPGIPAPTADVNLPAAMTAVVFLLVEVAAIRSRGLGGYFKHFTKPYLVLTPINIVEFVSRPLSLALRLFGNIFAGGVMLLLIATLLPVYVVPFGDVLWKLFDLFIGLIQAFIFALLTILYFEMAMGTGGEPH